MRVRIPRRSRDADSFFLSPVQDFKMENSSYKRRLDEMHCQSSLISSKRKRADESNFSTNSSKGPTTGTSFLKPFQDRYQTYRHHVSRRITRQDTPLTGTRITFAARPYAIERTSRFGAGDSSGYRGTPLRPHHNSPWNTRSNRTVSEVSAPSPVESRGLWNTSKALRSSPDRGLHSYVTKGSHGYGSFATHEVRRLTSMNLVGIANSWPRIATGVSWPHRKGLSDERLVSGNLVESKQLAKLKEEKRALEKTLLSAFVRRETGICSDLCLGCRKDMEGADEKERDALFLNDYKKNIASLPGNGERLSVITKTCSNLQQARFVAPDSTLSESLCNGILERSGNYHVGGILDSGKNVGDDGSASTSEHRDSKQVSIRAEWKSLLAQANSRDAKTNSLKLDIEYTEKKLSALSLNRPTFTKAVKKDEKDADAYTPLSEEAENEVDEALLGSDSNKVLTYHEESSIELTRAVMQCLLPGAWLNDEVINLFMELLKEREVRTPKKFVKCHFFNTFFYNKLYKDQSTYDYRAVRRWTTSNRLGYKLLECDKILVPIHQDIHWCLAVINIRDKKIQYLDSLKGVDNAVLKVLARYIADEAKDKEGRLLNLDTWEREFPQDIPQQLNGCDCGMFMLKYADFHSRGIPLNFKQADMPYFRRRMVWELLQLKAS